MVRKFIENEIAPHHAAWERDGIVPRDLWLKAGAAGLLCCTVPEEYGGKGPGFPFFGVVFGGVWRSGGSGAGFLIHTDPGAPVFLFFVLRETKPTMVGHEGTGRAT